MKPTTDSRWPSSWRAEWTRRALSEPPDASGCGGSYAQAGLCDDSRGDAAAGWPRAHEIRATLRAARLARRALRAAAAARGKGDDAIKVDHRGRVRKNCRVPRRARVDPNSRRTGDVRRDRSAERRRIAPPVLAQESPPQLEPAGSAAGWAACISRGPSSPSSSAGIGARRADTRTRRSDASRACRRGGRARAPAPVPVPSRACPLRREAAGRTRVVGSRGASTAKGAAWENTSDRRFVKMAL